MTFRKAAKTFSTVLLLLCLGSKAYPQECYPDPPQILDFYAHMAARQVVIDLLENKKSPEDAAASVGVLIQQLVFYAVSGAAAPDQKSGVFSLKAYEAIGETARTDKQIGASAQSDGSTSAVEKPGFAQLLGFAIENGAIQKQIDGTTLTLSTTPYALIAWANKGDTAELYRQNEFFARIGISASFKVANQSQPLADVNTKQLTEWSARVRLFGDRSTRSKGFQDFWDKNIRPKIEERLKALVTGFDDLLNEDLEEKQASNSGEVQPRQPSKKYGDIVRELRAALTSDITAYLKSNSGSSSKESIAGIRRLILCKLKNGIVDQIASGKLPLSSGLRNRLNQKIIPSLAAAHAALDQARDDFNTFWGTFSKGPLTTFAYTNHRTSMGSDYSEFKFLHEQAGLRPMKLVANAWVSIYSNPNRAMNQDQVRDYGAALSFEGQTNSPFLKDTPDLSKMTFAFTGRYTRLPENERMPGRKADIAVAQFKVEIPIKVGVSIPLSATYANATELIKEKHVRGNFGITFDVDKLFALTRRVLNP